MAEGQKRKRSVGNVMPRLAKDGAQTSHNGRPAWRLQWSYRDPGTNTRKTKQETFYGTRREARERWIEGEAEMKKGGGQYVAPSKQTVGEFLSWWIDTYAAGNLKATTLASYQYLSELHVIPAIGAVALSDLTPRHIAEWQADMLQKTTRRGNAMSSKTVMNARVMLHTALEEAVMQNLMAANPVSRVRAPKVETKRVDSFTREEIGNLMAAAEGHALAPIIAAAWQTGLRLGELRALKWVDVDFEQKTVRVHRTAASTGGPVFMQDPKTEKSARTIALSSSTAELLKAHRARQAQGRLKIGPRWRDHGLVFCTSLGTPMHAARAEAVFNELRDAAGLPHYSFHALRHTYASLALLAGVPLETVSENLGHRDISFTKRPMPMFSSNRSGRGRTSWRR